MTMANATQPYTMIHKLGKLRGLNIEDTITITKSLLENYRSAIWLRGGLSESAKAVMKGEGAEEVKQWYINLKELTNDEINEASIGSAIFRIFSTEWITKVVKASLNKVREFPQHGELYYNILTKKYLNEEDMKDEQVVSELDMDRATFYRRKKEAILLCGILMWEEARDKKME